ncbi:hypothetical protein, partial [Escherichia coli]
VVWRFRGPVYGRFEALNNKGEYIFIRNSVPGLSSVCIPYHD